MRDALAGFSAAALLACHHVSRCLQGGGRRGRRPWCTATPLRRRVGQPCRRPASCWFRCGAAPAPVPAVDCMLLPAAVPDTCSLAVLPACSLRCLLARHLGHMSPVHCRLEVTWRRQRQPGWSGQGHRLRMAAGSSLLPRRTSSERGRRAQGASRARGPPRGSRVMQLHRSVQTLLTVGHEKVAAHCLVPESQLLCSVALTAAHGCLMCRWRASCPVQVFLRARSGVTALKANAVDRPMQAVRAHAVTPEGRWAA